jgi:hypothetical protein
MATTQQVEASKMTSPTTHYPPPAFPNCRTPRNDGKQTNDGSITEKRVFRTFHLRPLEQGVHLQATVPTPSHYPSVGPHTLASLQNEEKQQNDKKCKQAEFWEGIKRVQVMVERVTKELKEVKADMAARSVTISPTLQLPIPPVVHTSPKVQLLPTLAWVPSPSSPTPILLVTHPVPASPMFPPGLQKLK